MEIIKGGNMKTKCPFCNKTFEVDEKYENEEAQCPSCGNDFYMTREISDETIPVTKAASYKLYKISSNKPVFCSNCGSRLNQTTPFCSHCGNKVVSDGEVPLWLVVLLYIVGLLIPFGIFVVIILTSVLYYAWKGTDINKAKKINMHGWIIFITGFIIGIFLIIGYGNNTFFASGEKTIRQVINPVPESFKRYSEDFIKAGNQVNMASKVGTSYIEFSTKVKNTMSPFDLMLKTYPEFKNSDAFEDFKMAIKGWVLCIDLWEKKINEYDNPTEPNVNKYQEFVDYMGNNAIIETRDNFYIVAKYRNKKYLPFDENIKVLMSISSKYYESGENKIISFIK